VWVPAVWVKEPAPLRPTYVVAVERRPPERE